MSLEKLGELIFLALVIGGICLLIGKAVNTMQLLFY